MLVVKTISAVVKPSTEVVPSPGDVVTWTFPGGNSYTGILTRSGEIFIVGRHLVAPTGYHIGDTVSRPLGETVHSHAALVLDTTK